MPFYSYPLFLLKFLSPFLSCLAFFPNEIRTTSISVFVLDWILLLLNYNESLSILYCLQWGYVVDVPDSCSWE